METLGAYLEEICGRYGSKPALQYKPGDATEVWTYSQLLERSNRVALPRQQRDEGADQQDRVQCDYTAIDERGRRNLEAERTGRTRRLK